VFFVTYKVDFCIRKYIHEKSMKNVKLFMALYISVMMISCSNDDTSTPETIITVKNFAVTIDENPAKDQKLGKIEAITDYGELIYSLKAETPKGALAIHNKTGKLTVKDPALFDYETRTEITATVTVKNRNHTKEAKVVISINDVNDAKITVKDFAATIDENPTKDQELGTIEATTDQGELSYTLNTQTPKDALTIDTKTGILTVKDSALFDYETRTEITATVTVKNGDLSKEAKVVVTLNNVIENMVFADLNFKKALLEHTPIIDTDNDKEISEDEVKTVIKINVHNKNISSLSGIEYFTMLTDLTCTNNKITTLDLSKNTKLITLYCYMNQLTTINLSENTKLTQLWCYDNQLSTLDVSKNTKLTWLLCHHNNLSQLDLSKNTKLSRLELSKNQLTTLDLRENTQLTNLTCNNNQLATLDLRRNIALEYLSCSNNQLSTLDVSKNTDLEHLSCENNKITTLNLEKNKSLEILSCENNQLTTIDVSKNTKLRKLWFNNNQFASLNMKNGNNATFSFVDITNNSSLTCIEVDNPNATYLSTWQKDATASYAGDCSTP
jgi:Leucine-rich repeat (LRR) protein